MKRGDSSKLEFHQTSRRSIFTHSERTYAHFGIIRENEINDGRIFLLPGPSFAPFEMNGLEKVNAGSFATRCIPAVGYIVLTRRLFVVGSDVRPLMSRKKRAIILGSCLYVLRCIREPATLLLLLYVVLFFRSSRHSRCCKSGRLNGITAAQPALATWRENYLDKFYDHFHKGG